MGNIILSFIEFAEILHFFFKNKFYLLNFTSV